MIRSTAKARFAVLSTENTKYGHKTDIRDTMDSPLACKVDSHRLHEIYIGNYEKDTQLFYHFVIIINATRNFIKEHVV